MVMVDRIMFAATGEKVCRNCGTSKPRHEFNRNKNAADGLQSHCKPCESAKHKEWWKRTHATKLDQLRGVTIRAGQGVSMPEPDRPHVQPDAIETPAADVAPAPLALVRPGRITLREWLQATSRDRVFLVAGGDILVMQLPGDTWEARRYRVYRALDARREQGIAPPPLPREVVEWYVSTIRAAALDETGTVFAC